MRQKSSKMKPHRRHFDEREIHYWTGGQGPALLLLHAGYGDAEFSWKYVWEQLANEFTVIAPDLPGFGETELKKNEDATTIGHMLLQLLRELDFSDAVVVGNSFGAALAYRFAQEHSERVQKLILVNGTAMPELPEALKKVLSFPIVHDVFVGLGKQMYYSEKSLRGAFQDIDHLPKGFLSSLKKNSDKNSKVAADIWLNSKPNETKVDVPIALVWGQNDEMVPIKAAEKMLQEYPEAHLHPIENARHMPEFEQPEAFAQAIKDEAESK
jgi:pimeloyl-ACP methyl ester carboxylesterase